MKPAAAGLRACLAHLQVASSRQPDSARGQALRVAQSRNKS